VREQFRVSVSRFPARGIRRNPEQARKRRSRMTGMNDKSGHGQKEPHKPEGLGTNSEIGRKLKQYYNELVTEQVPDRFMDLLQKLETKEDPSSKAKD
jgi:hypothetical protein